MRLAGEVVVVTGAGRGIGRAIALAQANEGASVALLARTAAEIEAVAETIAADGGIARAFAVDITDLDSVTRVFASIERDLGPVSLLTNNAGAFAAIGPIWTVAPDAWWRDVEINIRGTFNCCRAAIQAMLARRHGRIINMVGGGTATSFPHGSGYATSKAGLLRLTECVSDSLADTGVLVFAMDPGLVRTAMTEYQLSSEAGRTYLTNIPRLFQSVLTCLPRLRRASASRSGRAGSTSSRAACSWRPAATSISTGRHRRIMSADLRSLRVNGMPEERPRPTPPSDA